MTIGDRVKTPLGPGTLMDKDGYYCYVMVDTTGSMAEFYSVEIERLEE